MPPHWLAWQQYTWFKLVIAKVEQKINRLSRLAGQDDQVGLLVTIKIGTGHVEAARHFEQCVALKRFALVLQPKHAARKMAVFAHYKILPAISVQVDRQDIGGPVKRCGQSFCLAFPPSAFSEAEAKAQEETGDKEEEAQ